MRIFYFFLKFSLIYALRFFYPRLTLVNSPKRFFGRTIFVSNHAASFMDPLALASLRRPIIFFMTRSDVFKAWLKPIFWSLHMLPIYRQHDGEEMRSKNEAIFQKCSRVLYYNRNLLIFGEGFTDDVFIRRLKPLKKGAVRIGFSSLKRTGWKKKVYISAVGCNYSDPNEIRSDLLISHSDKICLNDYRKEYEENPNKVAAELTKRLEILMQQQITHVENKENAPFHENIMIITRRGMNARNFDRSISLKKRWEYSRGLANWMNIQDIDENAELNKLKNQAEDYFKLLKENKVEERDVFWRKNNEKGSRLGDTSKLVLLFPLALLGAIHCGIPYILIKRYVERTFKRKVFWSSVKLIIGQFVLAGINIPSIFAFYYLVYPSWWLAFAYFLSISLTGFAAYMWMRSWQSFQRKGALINTDLASILNKREALEIEINRLVPSKFD